MADFLTCPNCQLKIDLSPQSGVPTTCCPRCQFRMVVNVAAFRQHNIQYGWGGCLVLLAVACGGPWALLAYWGESLYRGHYSAAILAGVATVLLFFAGVLQMTIAARPARGVVDTDKYLAKYALLLALLAAGGYFFSYVMYSIHR